MGIINKKIAEMVEAPVWGNKGPGDYDNNHYQTGPVPLVVFEPHHLMEKPLSDFQNLGITTWGKFVRAMKDMCYHRWDNNNYCLTAGCFDTIIFPFNVGTTQERGTYIIYIYAPTGNGIIFKKVYKKEYLEQCDIDEVIKVLERCTNKILDLDLCSVDK